MTGATPHGDRLQALLANEKLPKADLPRVRRAIARYRKWLIQIDNAGADVDRLVAATDNYKKSVDLDLIHDSPENFLYRQKGQLKLDNTVLEEFLPKLVRQVFSEKIGTLGLTVGPATSISQLRFDSDIRTDMPGAGMEARVKDHDFVVAKPLFLKASHHQDFSDSRQTDTSLAYVAAELKTNLDKTMFQEAGATARDLHSILPSARYFLLCEWLDMTPISTAVTAIEEIIVLRKARRLSANLREQFASVAGRAASRNTFESHLNQHPLSSDAFRRFLSHLERVLAADATTDEVLNRGWF